jgi:tripartite-type tricarboxylate transporter receptor subunit TctC
VIQARPDGHTLLFVGNPTITIFPSLYRELPFNPQKDLAPVALYARMPMVLIGASDNQVKNVRQLIERVRLMPGRINYAALGEGSTSHLMGAWFSAAGNAELVRVNYNGGLPAINAVTTHNVELGFVALATALPLLKGAMIRVFAITSAARHPAIPEIPTLAESGLAGFDACAWFGVFAPAATPSGIVAHLNQAINKTLAGDFVQRKFIMLGLTAAPGSVESFRTLIQSDSERWAGLLKAGAGGR